MEERVIDLDERSLARDAARDADAFTRLYERYLDPVTAFMRANAADDATADDLASQVFFKALTSASTYRGDGSYRAWIFQIARNTLADHHAERGRLHIPVDEVPDRVDGEPSPAVLSLVDEERDLLWDAVGALPDAQREVVQLRYRLNLPIDEIARRTRRSSVAVRQLLHRAKHGLRRRLRARDVAALLGAATGTSALIAIGYRRHRRAR